MKIVIVLLLILSTCDSNMNNIKKYINKPVSMFIKESKYSNFKSYIWIHEPPLKLQGVLLEYDEDLFVEIRVDNFKHIKQFNKKMDWSFEDFKKELINSIVVYKEGENGKKIISSIFSKRQ